MSSISVSHRSLISVSESDAPAVADAIGAETDELIAGLEAMQVPVLAGAGLRTCGMDC